MIDGREVGVYITHRLGVRVGVLFDIKGYSNSTGSCAAKPTPYVRVGVRGRSLAGGVGELELMLVCRRLYSLHVGLQERKREGRFQCCRPGSSEETWLPADDSYPSILSVCQGD